MADFDKTEIQDDDEREDARQLSLQGNSPPSEIEGYSVVRRLGTGAYGTVWLAREDRTGRMVAIKYYPHRRGLNWSLLNREVEKLAALYSSRNIVRLLDVGWNAEPPYYVMEFVENGSLGEYLASGALGVEETVRITQQVCGALIEAHGAGVLHCDLKPDNVLLDAQYQVRLCDFGQSRMSHEQSSALGTLFYMAPEQANLEAIPDARWDVYAVGALMYHMLTGQPPYRAPDVQRKLELCETLQSRLDVYQKYINDAPLPDLHHHLKGMDKDLAGLVDQCLAVDPKQRLPNAQAILDQFSSRSRNRSRRPLLLLGVVGPLLLMAAMVPIFVGALSRNIDEMETQLVQNAQDRNVLTARGQATSLEDELENRLWDLEQVVAQEELIELMTELMQRPSDDVVAECRKFHNAPLEERPAWMQKLDVARQTADQQKNKRGKSLDTSWFLNDAKGRQLWRRDYSEATVGEYYAWRDYFHGTNQQYVKTSVPDDIKPITESHVSLAYISEATKRYMVALSVPIRSRSGEVIGVFARTLHLGDLQERLGQDIKGSEIALADRRTLQLLDHPWLKQEVFKDNSTQEVQEMFSKLVLDETAQQTIRSAIGEFHDAPETTEAITAGRTIDIKVPVYSDPVGKLQSDAVADGFSGEWIAAMSTMKSEKMPWLVIVQEDKSRALAPVAAMKRRATKQAWIAVLASLATMGCVWLFVWKALARTRETRPLGARES
ncbi:MAG: protein kinase [Fuerstiella sp.]